MLNCKYCFVFRILEQDFSIPKSELTATMKLKRDVINKNYAAEIDAMYLEKL